MTKKEHQVTQKPRGWERCRLGNHTTSLTPQLPPVKSSHLPTVTSHSSSLPWAPYLALEGDELGVKASKREVSKVRAPRHCGEALGAQVHAFGRAPPSSQRMVAVLGALGLLAGVGVGSWLLGQCWDLQWLGEGQRMDSGGAGREE